MNLTSCIIYKLRRNRFEQVGIAFKNIVEPILSVTFHVILGKPPVSKMKLLEKCHWSCSIIFVVSPVFIAALNVSVMGEPPVGLMILLKHRKTNFQVSVHKDGGNKDWVFVNVILKYQILQWQVNFTKYDFDQCQRKKRRDTLLWTVVASQRYP